MCPAGVYEIPEDAPEEGFVDLVVNPSNCVQCGAITAKGGRLTPPEGGDGPDVPAHISAASASCPDLCVLRVSFVRNFSLCTHPRPPSPPHPPAVHPHAPRGRARPRIAPARRNSTPTQLLWGPVKWTAPVLLALRSAGPCLGRARRRAGGAHRHDRVHHGAQSPGPHRDLRGPDAPPVRYAADADALRAPGPRPRRHEVDGGEGPGPQRLGHLEQRRRALLVLQAHREPRRARGLPRDGALPLAGRARSPGSTIG